MSMTPGSWSIDTISKCLPTSSFTELYEVKAGDVKMWVCMDTIGPAVLFEGVELPGLTGQEAQTLLDQVRHAFKRAKK